MPRRDSVPLRSKSIHPLLKPSSNFNGTNTSIGFIPPLFPGAYTFWIQEGFNGTFPYNFELVLNSVPEPSTALLMVAGLAMFLRRHRREKK